MKKIALIAVLAFGVFAFASGSNAAWVTQVNHAGGNDSLFNALLNMLRNTNIQVYNNANVEINETYNNNTGSTAIAGDDMEHIDMESGKIDQLLVSDVSVNDVAILVDDSATSSEEAIFQENGDDDTILNAVVNDEDNANLQTANNLEYVENLTVDNNTGNTAIAADDIEDLTSTTDDVEQDVTRGRVLGRVTVTRGVHIISLSL